MAQEDAAAKAEFDAIASADTMIMVPMRDGVGLATDVYQPKEGEGPLPGIFVNTPYNFNKIEGEQLEWACRDRYDKEVFMSPGEVYELNPRRCR